MRDKHTQCNNPDLSRTLNRPDARLILTYQGVDRTVAPGPREFRIGREADCDIVVVDDNSSRAHASLVYRKGKFVLIDHSTNGTFLKLNGDEELCLVEHEQCPLTGSGIISLGRSALEAHAHRIHFSCRYSAVRDTPNPRIKAVHA